MQDRLDDLDGHRLEISTLNGAYTSSRELLNSSVQDHLRYEAIWLEEKETLQASVLQLKRKVRILESRLTSRIEHVDKSESIPDSGVKAAEGHHVVSSANSYTQTCDRADVREDSQVPVPDSKIKELSAKLEKVESLYGNACASLVRQDELFLQNEQNFLTNLNEANLHRCDLLKPTDSLQAELRILRVELDGLEHEKVHLNGIIEDIMARVELGNSYPNRRKDPPGPPESGGSSIENGRRRIHGVPNVLLLGDSFLYRLSEEVRSLLPSKFSVTSQMMTDAPLSVLLSSLPPESSRPEYIVLSAGAVDMGVERCIVLLVVVVMGTGFFVVNSLVEEDIVKNYSEEVAAYNELHGETLIDAVMHRNDDKGEFAHKYDKVKRSSEQGMDEDPEHERVKRSSGQGMDEDPEHERVKRSSGQGMNEDPEHERVKRSSGQGMNEDPEHERVKRSSGQGMNEDPEHERVKRSSGQGMNEDPEHERVKRSSGQGMNEDPEHERAKRSSGQGMNEDPEHERVKRSSGQGMNEDPEHERVKRSSGQGMNEDPEQNVVEEYVKPEEDFPLLQTSSNLDESDEDDDGKEDDDDIMPLSDPDVNFALGTLLNRSLLKVRGELTVDLPDIKKKFGRGIMAGNFNATQGYFKNPATLHRTGDVAITHQGDTVGLEAALGLQTLDAGFQHYDLKILKIHQAGTIDVSVAQNSIKMKLSLNEKLGEKAKKAVAKENIW
ncbi:hypothetical protein GE061_005514 [Apolygus lucorum]|uniref:Uncharacterized protein n=1 Tax=Apolygus lucorum TaxID=248454 RepID=A0A8S9WWH9_APOLU|nr:hypothetical protein GE061_005514 [Apolygus lucorum]